MKTVTVRIGARGRPGASGASSWTDITGKPSTFPPSSHTHAIADTTGLQAALDAKAAASHTHAQSDVTGLTSALAAKADLVDGMVPTAQIPAIAITEFLGSVANEADMLALSGQRGDWCNRSDVSKAFVLVAEPASTLANWAAIDYPASPVLSVNGQAGTVVLGKSDVGLGNVPNTDATSRANHTGTQAISTVVGLQDALDGKAPTSHNQAWSTITSTPTTLAGYGITDAITAATAASTYAPIASPTFTGTITVGTGGIVSPNPLFPTRNITITQGAFSWQNVGGSGFGVQLAPSTPTADLIVNFNPNGAIVSTADTGTVTNAMLAGSIAISKIAATGSANSTTYLRGDGSWATPSGGGGSGGNWVLISTTTISGSPSTLDFTFSGSYRRYRLELENVYGGLDGYRICIRTSTDGGSTFDSGSANYGYAYGPAGTYGPVSTTGTEMITTAVFTGSASDEGTWGEIEFFDPLNAALKSFCKWELFGRIYNSAAPNIFLGTGYRDSAADVDTVRLFMSSGSFAGGKIRLFGWSE